MQFLDFEKPIADLEGKIRELSLNLVGEKSDNNSEILNLKEKIDNLLEKTYEKLSPWQITQVARHPDRPYTLDYIAHVFADFT